MILSAVQYIPRNSTKAGMVQRPWEYKWSSAAYHCDLVKHDILVQENEILTGKNFSAQIQSRVLCWKKRTGQADRLVRMGFMK